MRRTLWALGCAVVLGCGDGGGAAGDADAGADAAPRSVRADGGVDGSTPADCTPTGPERCNGADDDCDGETDETFSSLGQACTAGRGACQTPGVFACSDDGNFTECRAETPVEPTPEICNDVDDDCDGETDEDFDLSSNPEHCGACDTVCAFPHAAARCREATCVPGDCEPGWVDVDGAAENGCECEVRGEDEVACDGRDDDCDGEVDEGFGLGEACPVGEGACVGIGAVVCGPDGGVACEGEPRAPEDEVCNGVDDDCDGAIDEEFDGDGDGFAVCPDLDCGGDCPDGFDCEAACRRADCADDDAAVHPEARDVCDDGVDQDCSGRDRACSGPAGYVDTLALAGAGAPECRDLNGDGAVDNAFGALGALANDLIQRAIAQGALNLMPVAMGLAPPGREGRFDLGIVTGQRVLGPPRTYELNPISVDENGDPLMLFPGAQVAAGEMQAGPGDFLLSIPVPGGMPADVRVRDTLIEGTLSVEVDGLRIAGGVISGVVTEEDLDAALMAVPPQVRPLARQFLEADVDLNGDGMPDAYSACVTFTAVPATLLGFPVR